MSLLEDRSITVSCFKFKDHKVRVQRSGKLREVGEERARNFIFYNTGSGRKTTQFNSVYFQ